MLHRTESDLVTLQSQHVPLPSRAVHGDSFPQYLFCVGTEHTHKYTHVHAPYTHTYSYIHIHTYTHSYTHIHTIHTHIHTIMHTLVFAGHQPVYYWKDKDKAPSLCHQLSL